MIGLADSHINEIEQIEKSLYYLEKKHAEVEAHIKEIAMFENDLMALKEKLLKRKNEIKQISKLKKGGKADV